MKDILAKAVYINKKEKGDFHGSDGSLVWCPENVIDIWAFETRFVATRQEGLIVSAFSSRDHLSSVYDPPALLGSGLRVND